MSGKTIRAFSLSPALMQRVAHLATRLQLDPALSLKLHLQPVARPTVDVRGFTVEDYAALQNLTGSTLQGDNLLDYALKHPVHTHAAYKFVRATQRRNAKAFRLQHKAAAGSRGSNLSQTVEALLSHALESLEADVRPEESRGRKGRNAAKAA